MFLKFVNLLLWSAFSDIIVRTLLGIYPLFVILTFVVLMEIKMMSQNCICFQYFCKILNAFSSIELDNDLFGRTGHLRFILHSPVDKFQLVFLV